MVNKVRFPRFLSGRGAGALSPTPAVLATVLVLVVVFILHGLSAKFVPSAAALFAALPLVTPEVLSGRVWQLLTYGLVHPLMDPGQVFWNALGIYFLGRAVELQVGAWRFLRLVATGVLFGGVFVVAAGLLGIGSGVAIGAAGALQAVIVFYAVKNRNSTVLFSMVLPMRAIWLLGASLAFWLLDAVSASPSSAAAHLGGIAAGLIYAAPWPPWRKRRHLRSVQTKPAPRDWAN